MYNFVNARRPVLFAFVFCLTAFILSFLVLLAGLTPDFLNSGWVVLYDISSLTDDSANTTNDTQSSSSTRTSYDWYAFYYLSICHGNWSVDPRNSSSIDYIMTNTSCEHQRGGYQMSIYNFLPTNITLSDGDEYTMRSRSPGSYFATWLVGIVLAGVGSILIPFMLSGKIHLNGYVLVTLILANLILLIGAIFTTVDLVESAESLGFQYPSVCLGMQWAAVACMLFACVAEGLEWCLQRFTPKRERISGTWKPRDASLLSYSTHYTFRSNIV